MSLPPQDKSAKTLAQVHQNFFFFNRKFTTISESSKEFCIYFVFFNREIPDNYCSFLPLYVSVIAYSGFMIALAMMASFMWVASSSAASNNNNSNNNNNNKRNSKRFRRRRMGGHTMGFNRRQQREGREPRFLNSVDSISSFLCGFLLDLIENSFE